MSSSGNDPVASLTSEASGIINSEENQKKSAKNTQFRNVFILTFVLAGVMCGLMLYSFYQLKIAESKPSGHCPYFTNPNPEGNDSTGGTSTSESKYQTHVLVGGRSLPLDPNPYAK